MMTTFPSEPCAGCTTPKTCAKALVCRKLLLRRAQELKALLDNNRNGNVIPFPANRTRRLE